MIGATGVLLALAAAVCFGFGLPLQALRARRLPDLRTARAALAFLRDGPWWAASALVLAGWALELGALALAPAALVFPTAAAGIGVTAAVSARRLGERPSRADVLGVLLTGLGLAAGALTAGGEGVLEQPDALHAGAVGAALLAGAALSLWLAGRGAFEGPGLAAGAGFLYSGSGLCTKALEVALHASAGPIVEAGLVLLLVLFAAGGALVLQRALQRGRATTVAAWSTAISSVIPGLVAGPVFGEAWPDGLPGAARAASVAALTAGCLLLVGPARRLPSRASAARARAR